MKINAKVLRDKIEKLNKVKYTNNYGINYAVFVNFVLLLILIEGYINLPL